MSVTNPAFHPNYINACYLQMRNRGQNYIGFLGKPPVSIEEWRDEGMRRFYEGFANRGEFTVEECAAMQQYRPEVFVPPGWAHWFACGDELP